MQEQEQQQKYCILCKQPIDGYPHNAAPLAIGQCCTKCNYAKVVPARMMQAVEATYNDPEN